MIIESAQQMRDLGSRVAAHLAVGDVLLLSGPLGAGKTTFTQGLGSALRVQGEITSPTFIIARSHDGAIPLIHVDAYRLRSEGGAAIDPATALEDLDLDPATAVTVIEWGDELGAVLSDSFLQISIEFINDDTRSVSFTSRGDRWAGFAA